jgi:hypothetical protein
MHPGAWRELLIRILQSTSPAPGNGLAYRESVRVRIPGLFEYERSREGSTPPIKKDAAPWKHLVLAVIVEIALAVLVRLLT